MKPNLFKSLNWKTLPAAVAGFCLGVWACQGAEDVIKKSFQVEPGTLLVMEVDRGSIEVAPAGGNQVQIEVVRKVDRVSDSKAADIFSRHEVNFIQEGNEVRVKAQFSLTSSTIEQKACKPTVSRFCRATRPRLAG